MSFRLPRYTATALPREDVVSPREAAAGAMAPYQAAADIAGTISEFALEMMRAEDRSVARGEDAAWSFRLSEIESDPRWERDEIDGRPTEEVMFEEYGNLLSELEGAGREIRNPELREKTILALRGKAETVGLRLRDQADRIRIRRTKARDQLSIESHQRAGDFTAADENIKAGFADGIYSSAERDALLETNAKLQRLDPYIREIGSNDFDRLENRALDALDDPTLNADERIDMYRALSSAANSAEADYYQDRDRRWADNSTDLWANFDDIPAADIPALDVSPQTKKSALLMKRAEQRQGDSQQDDAEVLNQIYENIASVGAGAENISHISSVIAGHAAGGDISYETAVKLQQQLVQYEGRVFAGATFNDILRTGQEMITEGVPSEDLFNVYEDKQAAELAALASDWRSAMVESKIDQGPNFDPRVFYKENVAEFESRAKSIREAGISQLSGNPVTDATKYRLPGPGQKTDKNRLIEAYEKSGEYTADELARLVLEVEALD